VRSSLTPLFKGADQKKLPVSFYTEPPDAKKVKLEQKSAPCMDFNATMDHASMNNPNTMDSAHRIIRNIFHLLPHQ
jgi:CRISPR/Cas system CSM-associated protein Csm5 (group 7 of RAMP superfamily)